MKKVKVLCLIVALFSMMEFSVFAASSDSDVQESDVHAVCELPELRGQNSETFLMSDGSFQCKVYSQDKYFINYSGEMEKIDNTIEKVTFSHNSINYDYTNIANSIRYYFAENTPSILLTSDKKPDFGFSFFNNDANVVKGRPGYDMADSPFLCLQNDSCFSYCNVLKNTDLVYSLLPNCLKEFIVLKNGDCPTEFSFCIDTPSVSIESDESGTVSVYNNGELIYILNSLFAVDSKGIVTKDLSYEVDSRDESTVLKITINPDYLYASERLFPVIIDPSIMITGTYNTYDSYVCSRYPDTNYYLYNYLRTGRDEDFYVRRTYIKFDLPSSIVSDNIISAYINIRKESGSTPSIKAYRVTSGWDSDTITWNNRPGFTTADASATGSLYSDNWYRLYVTNIVKKWYTSSFNNYGFLIKDATESGTTQWTTFYSSDAPSPNKPELIINYNGPAHAYAGFTKSGSNRGVSSLITLPSSFPSVSDSGESVWVSTSKDSNGEWIQTGARYYSSFSSFQKYTEHYQNGVYKRTDFGTQALGTSTAYKVEYLTTDGKWHAYIGGLEKVSSSLASANSSVQAHAETHKSNIEMGPFTFSSVKIKNTSGTWVNNTTSPSAPLPYSVSGTPTNFTVSGP